MLGTLPHWGYGLGVPEAAKSFFLEMVPQDNLLFVRMDGSINEDSRLLDHKVSVADTKVLINLAHVERINSCGVRDWIRWISDLESRANTPFLIQCSPTVVAQINVVRNFCGARGQVVSFMAPYFCPSCDREHRELLTTAQVKKDGGAPQAVCEVCGSPMEFDDLADLYFAFARDEAAKPVDAEVLRFMNKFDDAHLATKLAALKELTSSGLATPGGTTPPGPLSPPPRPGRTGLAAERSPAPESPRAQTKASEVDTKPRPGEDPER